MGKKRKTFDVEEFRNYVNEKLKRTDDFATDKYKAGLCSMIEHVLHKTNNYRGFNHTYWQEKGYDEWVAAGKPETPEKDRFVLGPSFQEYNRHYY